MQRHAVPEVRHGHDPRRMKECFWRIDSIGKQQNV